MINELRTDVKQEKFDRDTVSDWMHNLGLVVPALRFKDCGQAGMGWVGVCPDGHEVYHAFTCEQRICPRCAAVRSSELADKLAPGITDLVLTSANEWGLKLYTFGTNVNLLDFMQLVGHRRLNAAALNSVRELTWALRGAVASLFREYQDADLVEGWGIGIEFGMRSGTLHFHVLALAKYIDYRKLSADWERHNEGHGSYVWVNAIDRDPHEIAKHVAYASKYVTKPLNKKKEGLGVQTDTANTLRMDAWLLDCGVESVMAALAYVFKGVRRFQTYGCFYDVDMPPEPVEVCGICGQSLTWMRELDLLLDGFAHIPPADLLKTSRTNKFCGSPAPPLDCPVQRRLAGF